MIVDFNSRIWTKPWFAPLPRSTQILFIYSWTNDHKNISGIYELGIQTIKNELRLTDDEIRDGFIALYPKLKYDTEAQIIWVCNHIKHQFLRTEKISPKIIIGINNSLNLLPIGHPFIGECVARYPLSTTDGKGNIVEIKYRFECDVREIKGFAASVPPAAANTAPAGGENEAPPSVTPPAGATKPLITFAGDWQGITDADRIKWAAKYPLVDLDAKLDDLGDWIKKNIKEKNKRGRDAQHYSRDGRAFIQRCMLEDQKKLAAQGGKVNANESTKRTPEEIKAHNESLRRSEESIAERRKI
jgi:hypothetical protein